MFRFLNAGRLVFNRALEHRIKSWRRRGESVTLYQQQVMLTRWRDRMKWIRLVPAQVERDALRRVDRGMKAFFRRVKAGQTPGFPRFKSRDRWRSFEVLQPGKYLRDRNKVHVPGIGSMRYRGMQPFCGAIKGIRVVRKARGWYVQLIVDNGPVPEKKPVRRSIGIDVGLTTFATLSDGTKINNPRWYRSSQRKLRFLQRIVSRRKAVNRVARFHERIADSRRGWIHQQTRRLVNEFDLIAVENLNIKGLSRTRLSKSILDAAWGEFIWQLSYKAESAGASLVKVNPRGTSQECSACGRTVPKTLSDRIHSCSCGYVACRDVNAAKNILLRWIPPEVTHGKCILAGSDSSARRSTLNREDPRYGDSIATYPELKSPYNGKRGRTRFLSTKKKGCLSRGDWADDAQTAFASIEARTQKIHDAYMAAVASGNREQSALLASVYRKHHASRK